MITKPVNKTEPIIVDDDEMSQKSDDDATEVNSDMDMSLDNDDDNLHDENHEDGGYTNDGIDDGHTEITNGSDEKNKEMTTHHIF